MNQPGAPGSAEPMNALVPFGEFGTIHFARFVIIEDETLEDFKFWNLPPPEPSVTLAFFGDCDGPAGDLLAEFADHGAAASGLRQIFACCLGFSASTDLLAWMQEHFVRPRANYVNWIGRTVHQIRKEATLRVRLQGELAKYTQAHPNAGDDPRRLRQHLRGFAQELMPAKTRTPIGWWIGNALHCATLPVLLVLLWLLAIPALVYFPFLLIWVVVPFAVLAIVTFLWLLWVAPFTFALLAALGLMLVPVVILCPPLVIPVVIFFIVLRRYEKSEPNRIPAPSDKHDLYLATREDHNVTNQYSVASCVKPSAFRRTLFVVILWLTNYGSRHIFNRGYLARIQTIHFARWDLFDGNRRAFFASNYDGSHQAYMDDFINKVGWGLNIVFSPGAGYPRRTGWCWTEPETSSASRTPIAATRFRPRLGTMPIRVSPHSISRATRASAKGCSGAGCASPRSAPGCATCERPGDAILGGRIPRDPGVVRFGYGHLPEARFHLVEIADAAKAREWIRGVFKRSQARWPVKSRDARFRLHSRAKACANSACRSKASRRNSGLE